MRIMQCWDDGDVDDIRLVDIFQKHGAKATFNINPGGDRSQRRIAHHYKNEYPVYRLTLDEMPELYRGFCIGGHSITHPDLAEMDLKLAQRELIECKAFIETHFGQQACGMAYPFGTYNDAVKQMVAEAGYLYSRTTQNVSGKLNTEDPMALHSHCHFLAADFWQRFNQMKAIDGDFYFWGHSFELMGDKKRWLEFERLIERISEDSATEWVDVRDLFMR